jgi:hypothetical protein
MQHAACSICSKSYELLHRAPMPPQISSKNGGDPPDISCGNFLATAVEVLATRD